MATFDDDLPAPPPPAGSPAPRSSAFDRVDDSALEDADLDAGSDPVFEQLSDELAGDLAGAQLPEASGADLRAAALPVAEQDGLPEETAVVLALTVDEDADLSPAEV